MANSIRRTVLAGFSVLLLVPGWVVASVETEYRGNITSYFEEAFAAVEFTDGVHNQSWIDPNLDLRYPPPVKPHLSAYTIASQGRRCTTAFCPGLYDFGVSQVEIGSIKLMSEAAGVPSTGFPNRARAYGAWHDLLTFTGSTAGQIEVSALAELLFPLGHATVGDSFEVGLRVAPLQGGNLADTKCNFEFGTIDRTAFCSDGSRVSTDHGFSHELSLALNLSPGERFVLTGYAYVSAATWTGPTYANRSILDMAHSAILNSITVTNGTLTSASGLLMPLGNGSYRYPEPQPIFIGEAAAIPEPSTALLVVTSLGFFGLGRTLSMKLARR